MKKTFATIITLAGVAALFMACANTDPNPSSQAPAVESQNEQITTKDEQKHTVETNSGESASAKRNGFDTKPPVGTKAFCPVMHNEFTVTESTQMSQYEGKTYAFCCPGCKPKFDANPRKYL